MICLLDNKILNNSAVPGSLGAGRNTRRRSDSSAIVGEVSPCDGACFSTRCEAGGLGHPRGDDLVSLWLHAGGGLYSYLSAIRSRNQENPEIPSLAYRHSAQGIDAAGSEATLSDCSCLASESTMFLYPLGFLLCDR